MKILVIAPTPFFADRGTHIRILEEALALEKRGHSINIATYHIGKDIHEEVATKIDVRRIMRLLFWYKKMEAGPDWQKIILDIMLVRKAFYLARTGRPDVIHGHLHEGVLIGWLVKKALFWRKITLLADFHGSLTKEMESHSYLKGGVLKSIFKRVEKVIDNLGDIAITSSRENTEEIKILRMNSDVETVLDGVNLNHYANLVSKEELKRQFELPENKTIIIYTGAMVLNKGIKNLLEAIPLVLEKNKDVFFVIAGFPIEDVETFVLENNLGQHVRIVSPLNYFDLPKILSASDIGIDPKDSSTMQASGKILGYMAAGLPVVCFDRPNNHEYLKDGAYYAKDISSQELAESILECAANEEAAQKKGELNRMRAENFSWDFSAEKIEKLLKEKKI